MPLRLVTVAGDPEFEARVAASIMGWTDFELVLRCVERSELLGAIRGGGLDAVITVGLPSWVDAQVADEARHRSVRIVEVGAGADERVQRLGIRATPFTGEPEDLVTAITDDGAPPAPPRRAAGLESLGRLIAVWGPKGAPGRSTLALELATEIAAGEPATLLVDGDPYGGDVLQLVGIVEELPTTVWASRMAAKEELDEARLVAELRRAADKGPVLLPGLPRAELWAEISDFGWRRLLAVVKASFRFTVCDVGFCLEPDASPYPGAGEGRNRVARATLQESDRVVAICRGDAVGVKQFLWAFEELKDLVDTEDVLILANRVPLGAENELGDLLKRHLGKRPVAYVPDRPQEFRRAVTAGAPVGRTRPGSDVAQAVRRAAAALGGRIPARGLLTRLGGRR